MTAALPMGGQKITGMADPTASTDGATKNYVDTTTAAFFSTGDLKTTLKTVADAGWVMGGSSSTIGNVGSGATYANVAALALYTLIWTNISSPTANAFCPVSGGLGASAAADWAGLKKLETGWYSGRALGFAGGGGSLTTRTLGQYVGVETVALAAGNIPTITATNATQAITVTGPNGHQIVSDPTGGSNNAPGGGNLYFLNGTLSSSLQFSGNNAISATYTNASPTAVSLMQPTVFVNVMIKL